MIVIHPTAEQVQQAIEDGKKMGVLWGSVTRGAGNVTGAIGEIIANEWLNSERVGQKVYSHDLELDGITYDVKSKRCSSVPLPEYAASVFAKKDGSVGIKADRLLFARVMDDCSAVYLLGWLTTKQFTRRAEFIEAGTRDGGFIHRASGWHVPISKLNKMEKLLPAQV